MKENNDFLQWYKDKVRENAQDPPEEVWENISNQLDVNDVWGKVSGELDERDRAVAGRTKIYYSAMLLLFLTIISGLIGFEKYGDFLFVNEQEHTANTSKENTTAEKINQDDPNLTGIGNPLTKSAEDLRAEGDQKKDNSLKLPYTSSKGGEIHSTKNAQKHTKEDNGSGKGGEDKYTGFSTGDKLLVEDSAKVLESNTETIALLKRIYPSTAFRLPEATLMIADSSIVSEDGDSNDITAAQEDEEDNEKKFERSFKIGLTASAKNTWLLNKTTYSGLEKHTLNTTVPDFGKDLGVLLDYDFSEKLALQGEVVLAEMGQKYKEYLNGKYVTREINLAYYNVHLLLKYKMTRLLGETESSIIIGSYGGALRTASEIISDNAIDQRNRFRKHDFGAVLGYELNQKVLKNLFFSSGLRFNYGFTNVNKDKMNRTSTGSLALNFAIKYKITKKNQ